LLDGTNGAGCLIPVPLSNLPCTRVFFTAEIDRVMKKVDEGCDLFDEIYLKGTLDIYFPAGV